MNGTSPRGTTTSLPYSHDRLLAYVRGEMDDTQERLQIEEAIEADDLWKAQYESVEFLRLEREAAIRDGQQLKGFQPTAKCGKIARMKDNDRVVIPEGSRLDAHALDCVYCRRMVRSSLARATVREKTAGIPLVREVLLAPYYATELERITEEFLPVVVPFWRQREFWVGAAAALLLGAFISWYAVQLFAVLPLQRRYADLDGKKEDLDSERDRLEGCVSALSSEIRTLEEQNETHERQIAILDRANTDLVAEIAELRENAVRPPTTAIVEWRRRFADVMADERPYAVTVRVLSKLKYGYLFKMDGPDLNLVSRLKAGPSDDTLTGHYVHQTRDAEGYSDVFVLLLADKDLALGTPDGEPASWFADQAAVLQMVRNDKLDEAAAKIRSALKAADISAGADFELRVYRVDR